MVVVVRVRAQGLNQARDKLGRFVKGVDEKSFQICLEEAPRIEAEAKLETPVESGDLRNSVNVSVSHTKRKVRLVAFASSIHRGYDYSAIQHENETFNHPNGGKAHFIRDPFNRGVERIKHRLREEVGYDK